MREDDSTVDGGSDGDGTFTVDDALCVAGFGKFQYLALAYAGMGWVSEAMEMMLLSFVGPSVQAQWSLSSQQESVITSIVFIGELIGAYAWGIVADNHGRRKGFLYTALVTSVAGFLSSFAPNYSSLLFLRFFVGIGLGGGPVLSSWFLEFVPAPVRGTWMVIFSVFWTVGTIFEALLGWAVMPTLGWRWLLALSSLPSFFLLVFYGLVPESPRYLCTKGRTIEAFHILEKLAKMNKTMLPPGRLVLDQKFELNEKTSLSEDTHLMSDAKNVNAVVVNAESKMGAIDALHMLLSPQLAFTTMLLWVSFFGNAFMYYGLVLLTSEMNNKNTDCSRHSLHSSNSEDVNLYKNVLITSLAEIPGIIIPAFMVDKIGRKISMTTLFFGSCIFLLPLIFHQAPALMIVLLFGARICITGSFNILYIYAPEVYPTLVRTTGVGIGSSFGRIGGILCPLVAVGLLHSCHQGISILLFELVSVISGIAGLLFPLETMGRQLNDVIPN